MTRRRYELPEDKRPVFAKAVRLERLTVAYLISATFFLYLTLGNSQALKAAWIEDLLSLLPPLAFLFAARFRDRRPNGRFPWGYHRVISIAYLVASTALLTMGTFILVESVLKLVTGERPPIGGVTVLGEEVWLGWLMLPALVWSAIPAFLLGRAKLPLASELHDKVLYADAKMNKADWLTAGAAMVGVVGIGLGLWWADAAAATAISLSIASDGWKNLRAAVLDLMDESPSRYDGSGPHPLQAEAEKRLEAIDWVEDYRVRLREEGHVFTGEAIVVPRSELDLARRVEEVREELLDLDWKLHDIVVVPVTTLEEPPTNGDEASEGGTVAP